MIKGILQTKLLVCWVLYQKYHSCLFYIFAGRRCQSPAQSDIWKLSLKVLQARERAKYVQHPIRDTFANTYYINITTVIQLLLHVLSSIYIIQFVYLFVCLFAFGAKTTEQNATKLSGIIKRGSRSVLHGLKLPVLQFLKRYPSISHFFAADSHFLNYCSLTSGYRAV